MLAGIQALKTGGLEASDNPDDIAGFRNKLVLQVGLCTVLSIYSLALIITWSTMTLLSHRYMVAIYVLVSYQLVMDLLMPTEFQPTANPR